MLKGLAKRNIVIWGTGKKAEFLMNQINYYRKIFCDYFNIDLLKKVEVFLDNLAADAGPCFQEREIVSPEFFEWDKERFFYIIAVLDNNEIINTLKMKGYEKDIHFITYQDFLNKLRKEIIDNLYFILSQMQEKKILNIDSQILEGIFGQENSRAYTEYYDKYLEQMKWLYDLVLRSDLDKNTQKVVLLGIVSMLIRDWDKLEKSQSAFIRMRKIFGDALITAGLAFYYDKEIDPLIEFFSPKEMLATKKERITTIGIYDERYHNGGAQRVLSLLMPIYIEKGYKVVFFTDEIKLEEEYQLPQNVVRIILKKYEDNISGRFNELLDFSKKLQIDVMCYHNKFNEIDFFYEMLLFKLQGIPVIAEIHLMFLQLITMKNGLADKFYKIYRLTDRLIVLSKLEQKFWGLLGCKSTYIPNPIDQRPETMNKFLNDGYEKNTILWIGRIAQTGKRILDVIAIMIHVIRIIPDAKLKIVGTTGNNLLLTKIKEQIRDNNLEGNIELCGYCTDLENFYQSAAVFLMTSELEIFPMVVAESKTFGVPLVLYDLPYIELLKDGKGYISVSQKNYKEIANAIISILQSNELRQKLSIEARESIKPFVEYNIGAAWERVFDQIAYGKNTQDENVDFEFQCIERLLLNCIWNGGN